MKTKYKYNPPFSYSLHDMYVNNINITDNNIRFEFENGYVKLVEPYNIIPGSIIIENVDFDFSSVVIQNSLGEYGMFKSEKLEIGEFIKKYDDFSFEIVDELYGYNKLFYSGYLRRKHKDEIYAMDLYVYFTGDIIYETEE